MHIESLNAVCFGGYRSLHLEALGAVTGLLGPNGHGKTTILQAIEYLLTGTVGGTVGGKQPMAMETYLFNYGGPGAADNGSVEGVFRQEGHRWRLMRQFGKTSKRVLELLDPATPDDAVKLTRADPVNAKLKDLFGADLAAAGNIVFLRQGALMTTLFGTETEREEMFVKFFGVGHVPSLGNTVTKKRQEVASNMPDLTKALDDAREVWESAERQRQDKADAYHLVPDHTADLESLAAYMTQLDVVAASAARVMQTRAAAVMALERHNVVLGGSTLEELESRLEMAVKTATDAQAVYDSRMEVLRLNEQYQSAIQAKMAVEQQLNLNTQKAGMLETVLSRMPGEQQAADELTALRARYSSHVAWANASAALQAATDKRNEFLKQPRPEEGEAERLRAEVARLRSEQAPWSLARQLVASATGACLPECPVCQTRDVRVSDTRAAEVDRKVREYDEKILNLSHQELAATRAVQSWNNQDTTTRLEVSSATAALQSVSYLPLQGETLESLKEDGARAAQHLATIKEKTIDLNALKALIQQNRVSLEHWITTGRSLGELLAGKQVLPADTARAEVERASEEVNRLRAILGQSRTVAQVLRQAEADHRTANQTLSEANGVADARLGQLTPQAAAFLRDHSAGLETQAAAKAAYADVYNRQTARNEAKGAWTQAGRAADEAKVRLDLLEEQLHRNAAKVTVCKELDELAGVFSRAGLPMSYVNYRFSQLAVLTSAVLSELRSDFDIAVSTEESAAFRFYPRRAPAGTWLHQNKLSGAQKVTLCVAFAIAMQRLILPRLGFLVLDEPTTHMDDTSVEALVRMLGEMSGRLRASHTQLWISDHHRLMPPAFDTVVSVPTGDWQPL